MSLTDHNILPFLYDTLASPPLSPTVSYRRPPTARPTPHTPLSWTPTSPLRLSPTELLLPRPTNNRSPDNASPIVLNPFPGSLLPTQHRAPVIRPLHRFPTQLHIDVADSLTRERKGKMPALSHLLSVGDGRALALAADERYVYAGCQSADNEIVVRAI